MKNFGLIVAGLLLFSMSAQAVEAQQIQGIPETLEPVISEYSAVTDDEPDEDLAAYREALTEFNEAIKSGDQSRALSTGLLALERCEKLSLVPSKDCAKLAVNLARLHSMKYDYRTAYVMYARALGHLTDAYGEGSKDHYEPLQEFIALAVRHYDLDEAAPRFEALTRVVKTHFDYPSEERGVYYLLEALLIKLERDSTDGSSYLQPTKNIKRALENAYQDFEVIGDHLGMGDVLFESARLDWEAGRVRTARKKLLKALDAYVEAGLPPGDARILLCHTFIAKNYLAEGRNRAATPHLQHVSRHQGDMDREKVQPLYRVAPKYPPRALKRRIEGWVLVEFTITIEGEVKDPVVLDSDPKQVFDRPSLEAVRQWRYIPLSKGGVLVESKSQVVLTYELAD